MNNSEDPTKEIPNMNDSEDDFEGITPPPSSPVKLINDESEDDGVKVNMDNYVTTQTEQYRSSDIIDRNEIANKFEKLRQSFKSKTGSKTETDTLFESTQKKKSTKKKAVRDSTKKTFGARMNMLDDL